MPPAKRIIKRVFSCFYFLDSMSEIIPAIMPRSFTELRESVEFMSGLADTIQIDVMDGIFVPEKSWPYTDGDYEGVLRLIKEGHGFPQNEFVDIEADLMIKNPEREVLPWIHAGARRIVVHFEEVSTLGRAVSLFKDQAPARERPDAFSKSAELGVALHIETPHEVLAPWIPDFSFVQFMGIARVGFQGEPFDERVLEKISAFRAEYPDVTISVDGGVSLATAPRLIAVGANRLVAGSAIWKSENMEETIEQFKKIM